MNRKGSLPKYLTILFKDYNQARSALRKLFRNKMELGSGKHPPLYLMRSFGYDLAKV